MRLVLGPHEPLLTELRQAAEKHAGGRLQVAVAWANDGGASLLLEATAAAVGRLEAIVGINNQGTTVEGLLRLLGAADALSVLYQHPMMTFHPKAYCFDDGSSGTLLVGSSNLTAGGLDTNFEASIVLDLTADLREQWSDLWRSLDDHAFSFAIASPEDVERLYKGGYVAHEAATRARRRRLLRRTREVLEGEDDESLDLPTEPPTRRFRPDLPAIDIPFEIVEEPPEPSPGEEEPADLPAEPAAVPPPEPAARSVFVRTLTPNDVAKLHGEQTGTFEPDLGLAARDEDPEFWRWPDAFTRVVRTLPRFERSESVTLRSRVTGPGGITVELVVWFREERPGHPAEFRLSPRPISAVRDAVPDDFDETSLLVVDAAGDELALSLLTAQDPQYGEYQDLLSVIKPAHRYGYGSRP